MKISFWISAIVVLNAVRIVLSNSIQVGTVLFTTTDLVKKCWSDSDKSLLRARLIMQDVLPDPDCIDFSKPNAVMIILEYFHSCYDIINTSTYGKAQNLMFLALSDALGGYLRAYMLPLTKRAFYAGQMKYSDANKLFRLYEDIKSFLKTTGKGWSKPQKPCPFKYKMKPLVISCTKNRKSACNELYTIEKSEKFRCINSKCTIKEKEKKLLKKIKGIPHENPFDCSTKIHKREFRNRRLKKFEFFKMNDTRHVDLTRRGKGTSREWGEGNDDGNEERVLKRLIKSKKHNNFAYGNETDLFSRNKQPLVSTEDREDEERRCRFCDFLNKDKDKEKDKDEEVFEETSKKIIIPLPILDDERIPHTVAVPFKNKPLRSLRTRNSAFILQKYYTSVIKCLVSKNNTVKDIKNFNAQFHTWLIARVFPHLTDEEWYPAFGGVLRVLDTIKNYGAETSLQDPFAHDIAFMFSEGFQVDLTSRKKGKEKPRDVTSVAKKRYHPRRYYLYAVIIMSSVWVCIFCTCAFYLQAMRTRTNCDQPARIDSDRKNEKRKEKFLNFQFIIRFFKRKDPECHDEECHRVIVENENDYREHRRKKYKNDELAKRRKEEKFRTQDTMAFLSDEKTALYIKKDNLIKLKMLLGLGGAGDSNVAPYPFNPQIQAQPYNPGLMTTWPCQLQFNRPVKHRPVLNPLNLSKYPRIPIVKPSDKDGDQIHTIWKKPSNRFKRKVTLKEFEDDSKSQEESLETDLSTTTKQNEVRTTVSESVTPSAEDGRKDESTEKRSSFCCYSESCSHTCVTSTNTSSQTQVEEKFSSATMEFFEQVIAGHKSAAKSSAQESTEESESDDESYSSESDD